MNVLTTPDEMRAWSDARRADRQTVALVPTMGALHEGHHALVHDARTRADAVVVSIFVNPLQFNEAVDFDAYPRPIDDDLTACRALGVDAVYAPTAASLYPPGHETRVVPGALATTMEGAMRPGHFEGVTTVVTKLFGAVRPHLAVFGQKDYQQLQIVRRMTADLDLGVEIVAHPIVRETDGVARSSRNVRLDAEQRAAAICVPRSLDAASAAARGGADVQEVIDAARAIVEAEPLARHEYTAVFDSATLQPCASLAMSAASSTAGSVRVATAVWFGEVRLIDNCDLFAGRDG